jgi:hypothetical protein
MLIPHYRYLMNKTVVHYKPKGGVMKQNHYVSEMLDLFTNLKDKLSKISWCA